MTSLDPNELPLHLRPPRKMTVEDLSNAIVSCLDGALEERERHGEDKDRALVHAWCRLTGWLDDDAQTNPHTRRIIDAIERHLPSLKEAAPTDPENTDA